MCHRHLQSVANMIDYITFTWVEWAHTYQWYSFHRRVVRVMMKMRLIAWVMNNWPSGFSRCDQVTFSRCDQVTLDVTRGHCELWTDALLICHPCPLALRLFLREEREPRGERKRERKRVPLSLCGGSFLWFTAIARPWPLCLAQDLASEYIRVSEYFLASRISASVSVKQIIMKSTFQRARKYSDLF